MRLTTIAARLRPGWRAFAGALASVAPLVALLVLIGPSVDYMSDQSFIETPALGWPDSIRTAAVPVGFGLMIVLSVLHLLQFRLRDVVLAAVALGAVAGLIYAGRAGLAGMGSWNLVVFFVVLLGAGVLIGVPIAFTFILATVGYLLATTGTPLQVMPGRMDEGMSSLILLAVPLFILLGGLIELTQMARAMVAFLAALVGHVRGGLQYVLLGAMVLVSGDFGVEDGGHGGGGAGADAGDAQAGAGRRGDGGAAGGDGGDGGDDPAVAGVDRDRVGDGGVDRGAVHGRVVARDGVGDRVGGVGAAADGAGGFGGRGAGAGSGRGADVRGGVACAAVAGVDPLCGDRRDRDGDGGVDDRDRLYRVVRGVDLPALRFAAAVSDVGGCGGAVGAILFIIGAANGMAWALTQSGFSHGLAAAMAGVPGGRFGFLAISIVAFVVLGKRVGGDSGDGVVRGRCCFRWLGRWGCTRCIMRWW